MRASPLCRRGASGPAAPRPVPALGTTIVPLGLLRCSSPVAARGPLTAAAAEAAEAPRRAVATARRRELARMPLRAAAPRPTAAQLFPRSARGDSPSSGWRGSRSRSSSNLPRPAIQTVRSSLSRPGTWSRASVEVAAPRPASARARSPRSPRAPRARLAEEATVSGLPQPPGLARRTPPAASAPPATMPSAAARQPAVPAAPRTYGGPMPLREPSSGISSTSQRLGGSPSMPINCGPSS